MTKGTLAMCLEAVRPVGVSRRVSRRVSLRVSLRVSMRVSMRISMRISMKDNWDRGTEFEL